MVRLPVRRTPTSELTRTLTARKLGGEVKLADCRAIAWIEDALAPLRKRMRSPALRRLVFAIRAAIGIEPLVWLTDIAGLPSEEAVALMRESTRTLLRAALEKIGEP